MTYSPAQPPVQLPTDELAKMVEGQKVMNRIKGQGSLKQVAVGCYLPARFIPMLRRRSEQEHISVNGLVVEIVGQALVEGWGAKELSRRWVSSSGGDCVQYTYRFPGALISHARWEAHQRGVRLSQFIVDAMTVYFTRLAMEGGAAA